MTRKYTGVKGLLIGFAAALGIFGMSVSSASAMESWAYDNSNCKQRAALAADGVITTTEAESLARLYLSEIGYARVGTSTYSARVVDVRAYGGKWRVEFRYGGRLPTKTALFFIDMKSGLVGMDSDKAPEAVSGT